MKALIACVVFLRKLKKAWEASYERDLEWLDRRVQLIEGRYRRRYAGRPLAWLRTEVRLHYAGYVLVWRPLPDPVKVMLAGAALGMFSVALGPSSFLPLLAGVRAIRPRRVPTQLAETLDAVDATKVLDRLQAYRPTGRQGYPLRALWRGYLVSFVLDLPSTNALIRRLQDDPALRALCGFTELPHRTTFNRFNSRLSHHRDLVESCMAAMVGQLRDVLPDLGEKVAVDSTTVRSHSNGNRKSRLTRQHSDSEASWTPKNHAGGKDQKDWLWGYKYHLVADAKYGVPLFGQTTTAKKHDSPELPGLLDGAAQAHPWLRPRYIMADRGYDSRANHEAVSKRGGLLIAPTRRNGRGNRLYEGIYTEKGAPTCMGMVEMDYVRSDPQRGHLYRCPPGGCHLKARRGVRYCDDEEWENRRDDPRLFGPLRQKSPEWKVLYKLRQSVERVFKGMKESRRLERHCVRGLLKVSLHAAMSALAFTATVLVQTLTGDVDYLWMVRRVA